MWPTNLAAEPGSTLVRHRRQLKQKEKTVNNTVGDNSDTTAHPTQKHTTLAHKYACTIIQVGRGLGKWAASHAYEWVRRGRGLNTTIVHGSTCTPGAPTAEGTVKM